VHLVGFTVEMMSVDLL